VPDPPGRPSDSLVRLDELHRARSGGTAPGRRADRGRPPAARDPRLYGPADARPESPAARLRHALGRAITALRRAARPAAPRGRGAREGGQGGLPANARGHSPPLRATRPAGEAAIGHGGDTSWLYWALWSAAFAALTAIFA